MRQLISQILARSGSCGIEGGALLKGIGGELGGEGFERQRLVAGCDVEVEIAPGAPPERLEGAMRAAVGKKAVADAEGRAVAYFVAIALVFVFVVERLRVGEPDLRALAAGDGEQRIGGGEGLAIEKNVDVGVGGNRGRDAAMESAFDGRLFLAASVGRSARRCRRIRHVRQRVGHQAPGIVARWCRRSRRCWCRSQIFAIGRGRRNPGGPGGALFQSQS